MFKKDDYIVCLNTPIDDKDFPPNFVFKQSYDYEYLSAKKDNCGYSNGWPQIQWDGSKEYSKWRYATPEEIEEYDRLGKPYDVTTLNSFVLPKKWYVKSINFDQDVVLTSYFNHLHNGHIGPADCSKQHTYYYNEKINNVWWGVGINRPDSSFKEITYDQFVKYVLNQNTNSEDMSALINLLKQIT